MMRFLIISLLLSVPLVSDAAFITDRLHIGNRWLGHLGLAMYDNTARVHDPVMPHMLTCDSRAVDYPGYSPFSHCAGNPANMVDFDGNSTYVEQQGVGRYIVVGGNLDDNDFNIYVNNVMQNNKPAILGQSALITSFYDSDKDKWEGVIDLNDNSGQIFLDDFISNTPGLLPYMNGGRTNGIYDFKAHASSVYNGMPVTLPDGRNTIISARDLGNFVAGYDAGVNGMYWATARIGFDTYQSWSSKKLEIEGVSSQNAQMYGWCIGNNKYEANKNNMGVLEIILKRFTRWF